MQKISWSQNRTARAGALLFAAVLFSIFATGCGGGGTGGVLPNTTENHSRWNPSPKTSPSPAPSTSASPAASPTPSTVAYSSDLSTSASWLDAGQLSDGAILYSSSKIEPYFANLAATGWTKVPAQLPHVEEWMKWFVSHINSSDVWGLGGTIYDYTYTAGAETPTNSADSVDAYNATFLTLARELYDTGDASAQQYVASIRPALEELANTILALQQSDGLTIAMPSYKVAYLMDDSEVYRGLNDVAYLDKQFGNASQATTYANAASRVAAGIDSLWNSSDSTYAYAKGEPTGSPIPAAWNTWYPDATAQLFPILDDVLAPYSPQAESVWNTFNATYASQWQSLNTPDGFPWALVADTAALMNDTGGAATYIGNAQSKYAAKGFPWPWYCAEDGWYMRTLHQLEAGSSVALADN
jgi:hypothetical protein